MRTKLILAVASVALVLGLASRARVIPAANPAPDEHQALVDRHMSTEAALAVKERKAVAAVRADLWQDEEQMRAAVRKIRRDYRAQTGIQTELHDSEKKALD